MRVGYLNIIGGASGDMLLAALLDAGLPLQALEAELAKLGVSGYRLAAQPAVRRGLHGTHLRVELDGVGAGRRSWSDFKGIIDSSGLPSDVRDEAQAVFVRLEEAERRAHRVGAADPSHPLDELGTVDTLVDVVGVVAGVRLLGIEMLYSSPLPTGSGIARSAHGPLPAAAPATMEIIAGARAPVAAPAPGVSGELVTPTGAALITTLSRFQPPTMNLERVGYGLGTRDPEQLPNALALWVGEAQTEGPAAGPVLLETNIDDMTPVLFGYVQERLFALGALDVWFTSIQMKKNRPGVLISALVPPDLESAAVALLLRETSTLGIRRRAVQRYEAARDIRDVETSLGTLPVKVKYLEGTPVAVSPEFEACRLVALEMGLPLAEVLRRVEQEARLQLLGGPE